MFNNDIKQAEVWLKEQAKKEGWDKASKLQDRPMSQGLVGISCNLQAAAMVEVNCETDFVARNKQFQTLVTDTALSCLHHFTNVEQQSSKMLLDKQSLSAVQGSAGQSLADLTALTIGNLGENMLLQRAACVRAPPGGCLGVYVHTTGQSMSGNKCLLGKYGCVLAFHQHSVGDSSLSHEEVGRQLAQHVVGMNPSCVGSSEDTPLHNKDNETNMIHQEFLLNPEIRVSEFLEQNGAEVMDFVRFECGENSMEE